MVSLCGEPASGGPSVATHFPDALSMFAFGASGIGYTRVSTMSVGQGYWINLPTPQERVVLVRQSAHVLWNLPPGWSMLGGPDSAVGVAEIRAACPDIVSVFGFEAGYQTVDTLAPGRGYWVNTRANLQATIPAVEQ